jgi:hypothetical protein
MKVYFGAGIQGASTPEVRAERAALYRAMIEHIQSLGHEVLFEHTATNNKEEVWEVLEKQFGPLPPAGPERSNFIRNRNIEAIEHMADAAIFEVSMPSLGVGIELAHAYLRPKMGLKPIPILCLYQKGFWGHGLSIMVSGAAAASEHVKVVEYENQGLAKNAISSLLKQTKIESKISGL